MSSWKLKFLTPREEQKHVVSGEVESVGTRRMCREVRHSRVGLGVFSVV